MTSDGMPVTIRSAVEHKSEKKFGETPNPISGLFPRTELLQNAANLTESLMTHDFQIPTCLPISKNSANSAKEIKGKL